PPSLSTSVRLVHESPPRALPHHARFPLMQLPPPISTLFPYTTLFRSGIFSAVSRIADMEVKSIFTSADLPDYKAYTPQSCPMCREGKRVEALVNSYGYSKL